MGPTGPPGASIMFNIGPMELILILVVALVVVGPKRLPEVGRTIGKSLREFKKAQEDVKRSLDLGLNDDDDYDHGYEPSPPPKWQPPTSDGDADGEVLPGDVRVAPVDEPTWDPGSDETPEPGPKPVERPEPSEPTAPATPREAE